MKYFKAPILVQAICSHKLSKLECWKLRDWLLWTNIRFWATCSAFTFYKFTPDKKNSVNEKMDVKSLCIDRRSFFVKKSWQLHKVLIQIKIISAKKFQKLSLQNNKMQLFDHNFGFLETSHANKHIEEQNIFCRLLH